MAIEHPSRAASPSGAGVTRGAGAREATVQDAMADPDVQLMLRVQVGDTQAFRELFRRFSGKILQYVRRMVSHQARAEELTQDVFVQVFRFRDRYRPESRLSTWIFRIATNVCLNELRRPERRLRVDLWDDRGADGDRREVVVTDGNAVSPEDGAAAAELGRALAREIGALPPKQRAALLLSRVDGLHYREVAEVLGCTEGAVKALVFRATQGLKARLEAFL